MSVGWAAGSTREWRKIRAGVLMRDRSRGWKCRAHDDGWCRRGGARDHVCERHMSQVHHLRGVAAGHDPRWLVGSCPPCNTAIGDPTRAGDPVAVAVTAW